MVHTTARKVEVAADKSTALRFEHMGSARKGKPPKDLRGASSAERGSWAPTEDVGDCREADGFAERYGHSTRDRSPRVLRSGAGEAVSPKSPNPLRSCMEKRRPLVQAGLRPFLFFPKCKAFR